MKELPPTVYIVDDDSGVRSSIRVLMKSVGLPAMPFPSAKEFLAAYHPNSPGCLVLDIRMPGMSGLELQEALNERGAVIQGFLQLQCAHARQADVAQRACQAVRVRRLQELRSTQEGTRSQP